MNIKRIFAVLALLSTLSVTAQELRPIIFSSKQENPSAKMTSSVYVVEKNQIENQGHLRAVDILRRVPGVEVQQTGIVGGSASIFIRGSESRHTVIMIDGVKVYDPTQVSRSFNLSLLNSLDIEKVEVLKGAQSVLYGSDAIGGVVNIITKKGEGKNRVEVGLGIAKELSIGHTIDFDRSYIYMSGYYQDSEFASDVDDRNITDQKINKGVSAVGGLQWGVFDFETIFKLTDDFAQTDGQDINSKAVDNRDAYAKNVHIFFKQGVKYQLSNDEKIFADYSLNKFERTHKYGSGNIGYNGIAMASEVRYLKQLITGSFVAGINVTHETYQDDDTDEFSTAMQSFFGNRTIELEEYVFEGGARLTQSGDFGGHLIYSAGVKRQLTSYHTVRASYKTGFQAPSSYQLFGEASGQSVGNNELAPEKSENIETGYDYHKENFLAGFTFFHNNVDDYIAFENSHYVNVDGAKIIGIDSYSQYDFDKHSLGVNLAMYQYYLSSGDEIARRPERSVNVFYRQNFTDEHSFGGNLGYRGKRVDYIGKKKKILAPYQVLDLNYAFSRGVYTFNLFLKNIFDTQYEIAKDYTTQRRGVQVHLEYVY